MTKDYPLALANQVDDLELIDAADWLETIPDPPDQILGDMLDAGDKMVLIGSSKMRKSFFTQQMGLSIAVGRDFLSILIPKRRRVLYVQFEIRKQHSHRRTRNLARAIGINADELRGQFLTIPARGKGIRGAEGLQRIKRKAASYKPEVIILDPLYKLAEGVENAAEDLKVILNAFDELAEATGAAIIYVHHDPKGSPGDRNIRDRGAGSNVLGRDYDACVTLTPHISEPEAVVVEMLLRNYQERENFTVSWCCNKETGGYCFERLDSVLPAKRTSKTKAAPSWESYLPAALEVLDGKEMEVTTFKARFQDKTGLGDNKMKQFLSWATLTESPPLQAREERGYRLHRKWVSTAHSAS
jgi:RecA-family ATPase